MYKLVLIFIGFLQETVGMLIEAAMAANASLSNATAIEAVSQSNCWVIRMYVLIVCVTGGQRMMSHCTYVCAYVLLLYADYYRKSCSMCK